MKLNKWMMMSLSMMVIGSCSAPPNMLCALRPVPSVPEEHREWMVENLRDQVEAIREFNKLRSEVCEK